LVKLANGKDEQMTGPKKGILNIFPGIRTKFDHGVCEEQGA